MNIKELKKIISIYRATCATVNCHIWSLASLMGYFSSLKERDNEKERQLLSDRSHLQEVIATAGEYFLVIFDILENCPINKYSAFIVVKSIDYAQIFVKEENLENINKKIYQYFYDLRKYLGRADEK